MADIASRQCIIPVGGRDKDRIGQIVADRKERQQIVINSLVGGTADQQDSLG